MDKIAQINAIHGFLRSVFRPGDLIEVRGLRSREGTLRILTRDLTRAAQAAVAMERLGADVYYALNPVDPDSRYARTQTINYAARRCPTARDKDIASRNLYLVDIDPVRQSGTAATKEQRAAAMATSQEVHTYLTGRGWSDPVVIDSGNGVHMIFRGNRCSADDTELKIALKALNKKFGGRCSIDSTVSNPARIARLPYCVNRKAGRRARPIYTPPSFDEMLPGLVYRLAVDEGGYSFTPQERRSAVRGTLLLDEEGVIDLIDEFPNQLELDGVTYKDDATYFALEACPFKGAPHTGQSVGMGKTTIILRPDSIGFKCFSDDCADHTFGSLLKLLHAKTGRWPSMQIWGMDETEPDKHWPDVEALYAGQAEEEDDLDTLIGAVPMTLDQFELWLANNNQ